jgi:CubicO group peptidase (beta-lactamase class C family)
MYLLAELADRIERYCRGREGPQATADLPLGGHVIEASPTQTTIRTFRSGRGVQTLSALAALLMACGAGALQVPAQPSLSAFEPAAAEPAVKEKLAAIAPQLDTFFQGRLDATGATGLAVGIVVDGELVYGRGFGVLDPESRRPIDLDSVFRIASVSKSFTAMAVMKLRDEGKLSLDVPLSTYLPELNSLTKPTQDSPPITARLLLTHASGLPWDDYWGGVSFGFNEDELAQLLRDDVSFAHAPGVAFEYSNLGYALLGLLVERVGGVRYRDYVTANILRPLGMHSTVWSAEQVPEGKLTAGDWGPEASRSRAPTPASTVFAPAGGLYTSMRDYARYVAYQLSAYPPRDEPQSGPVRRSTLREMHQGQRLTRMPDPDQPIARRTASGIALSASSYGFGWFNSTTCSEEGRLEHAGWEPGYFTAVILLPQHRFGIVTMATSHAVRAAEAALGVIRNAGALPPVTEPTPNPRLLDVQRIVNGLLTHWDPSAVDTTFDPRSVHYPWFRSLQKDFTELARVHGRCTPDGMLRARNVTEASWRMRCERGALEFTAVLVPTKPPRVQWLRWKSELPPDEQLTRLAHGVAASIGGSEQTLAGMLAPSADSGQISKQLAHAAIDHGSCRMVDGTAKDANTRGVFRLECKEGQLELSLDLDPQSRQITALALGRPNEPGEPCWQ